MYAISSSYGYNKEHFVYWLRHVKAHQNAFSQALKFPIVTTVYILIKINLEYRKILTCFRKVIKVIWQHLLAPSKYSFLSKNLTYVHIYICFKHQLKIVKPYLSMTSWIVLQAMIYIMLEPSPGSRVQNRKENAYLIYQ